MATGVPEGWGPYQSSAAFIDRVGPVYRKREIDAFCLGIRVDSHHCNKSLSCHGGMLSALCDMLVSHCAFQASKSETGGVTVSLNIDLLSTVRKGVWLEGRARPRKIGRSLVFVDCTLVAQGRDVVRATGIWKVGRPESVSSEARNAAGS